MPGDPSTDEHLAAVFRFAWALAGDEAAAVDLAQRVFSDEAARRRDSTDAPASEVALLTAAYRLFTRGELLPIPPAHDRVGVLSRAALARLSDLETGAVFRSFRELELPQRAALVLFHTTHCSLRDIAAIMHCQPDEITAIIARGKAEWLHILQHEAAEPGGGSTP